MTSKKGTLSTDSYKGVRDFYPEDKYLQNYIFDVMSKTAESFGYLDYSASILEPTELYESKTSDEIINEQAYNFEDRGGRRVTLRPEMTPSVARMVAGKSRELTFPLRLYSIPNLFRYERPQRGRLREHWQLNADIFLSRKETDTTHHLMNAEVEIIHLAHSVLTSFGASEGDFEIRIGSRNSLQAELDHRKINPTDQREITQLIDKKGKLDESERTARLKELGADFTISESEDIKWTRETLKKLGINNTIFDPDIVRGFDYYTGIVFEIFDTSKENKRSIAGGGGYGNLTELFGGDQISGTGFGMGDVTITDFLETHNLLPEYQSSTDLYICTLDSAHIPLAQEFAQKLRLLDISTAVNYTDKKVGDQIKLADKSKIPFVLCIGENEIAEDSFTIKNLKTGNEEMFSHVTESDGYKKIAEHIFGST